MDKIATRDCWVAKRLHWRQISKQATWHWQITCKIHRWVCKLQGWVCKLNSVVCIFWFALLLDKIATRDCLRSMKRMQWTSSTLMLLLRWLQHMLKCPTACSKNEKNQKPWENQTKIFQDSCKSKTAKIQKTSRKPNKPNKNKKKQYSRTLAKVKMKKSKKPREKKIPKDSCKSKHAKIQKTSRKPKKKQKKQYPRTLACWPYLQTSGILFFLFDFFGFSRGFSDFCIFTFARVLEYCFFLFFFCLVFSRFIYLHLSSTSTIHGSVNIPFVPWDPVMGFDLVSKSNQLWSIEVASC